MSGNALKRLPLAAAVIASFLLANNAHADAPPQPEIKIGVYSQNEGPTRASGTATIDTRSKRPATARQATSNPGPTPASYRRSRNVTVAPTYPTLTSSSPLIRNATPFGPGTFWYSGGAGVSCIYAANSSPLCFRITGPAPAPADPATLAASVASRLDLTAGTIDTSPSGTGLTGAASWFWLQPAPTSQQATITLAGETVTVEATPTIEWLFGDGATLPDAGPGMPYQPGPTPPTAVTRTYQARCLPGDQGRNPNVLPSCGDQGYQIIAKVVWQFSYRATGPVNDSGTVAARETDAERAYPVSEARAFLVGARQ